jgi:hypothetical protein
MATVTSCKIEHLRQLYPDNIEAQQAPMPYKEQRSLLDDESLKGTTPTMFNGNWHNTKQFAYEFMLYQMVNQDMVTMRNGYT